MDEALQARQDRIRECENTGREVAQILLRSLNSMSTSDEKALIDGFSNAIMTEHRTLQQKIANVFYTVMQQWAEMFKNSTFDDRNQATVTWASKCMDATGEVHFPYI